MNAGVGRRAAAGRALAGALLAAGLLVPAGSSRAATAGAVPEVAVAAPPVAGPEKRRIHAAHRDTAVARAAERPAPVPAAPQEAPEAEWRRCPPLPDPEPAREARACAVPGAHRTGLGPPARPLLVSRAFLEWQLRECYEREDDAAGP